MVAHRHRAHGCWVGGGGVVIFALGGVASTVVGSALFLRYSLTNFLRFWLARQSYDLDELGTRLVDNDIREKDAA